MKLCNIALIINAIFRDAIYNRDVPNKVIERGAVLIV